MVDVLGQAHMIAAMNSALLAVLVLKITNALHVKIFVLLKQVNVLLVALGYRLLIQVDMI